MISNQQVTAQVTLTPAMIENLLKDPTSWLSRQQQAAVEERLRIRKELIKQEYLLAQGKEMDDRIAKVEAQKLLDKEAEQARVHGLDKYYKEQHQLALKLGTSGTLPTYFDVLLTRQADLARAEMLLGQRNLELTYQIKVTQAGLEDTQAELEVVTHKWTEAKLEVEKEREKIEHKFNNDMIVVEEVDQVTKEVAKREVSVSTNVLSRNESKRVEAYRVDAIDRLVEAYNDGSMRNKDGSIDQMKYGIIIVPAFKPVLAAQGVRNSTRYAEGYAKDLQSFVVSLANIAMQLEMLNRKRQALAQKEKEQLEELADQMRKQKELLREMVKVREERLQLERGLAANSSSSSFSYSDSDASLIGTIGFLAESRQRERQRAAIDKQQDISLEKPGVTATEGTARGMRAGRAGG